MIVRPMQHGARHANVCHVDTLDFLSNGCRIGVMLSTQSRTAHATSMLGAILPVFIVARYRHPEIASTSSGWVNREGST